jgi:hypothetical protein
MMRYKVLACHYFCLNDELTFLNILSRVIVIDTNQNDIFLQNLCKTMNIWYFYIAQ